ncbi:unnamed protein product [Sphacelaria rigidula]
MAVFCPFQSGKRCRFFVFLIYFKSCGTSWQKARVKAGATKKILFLVFRHFFTPRKGAENGHFWADYFFCSCSAAWFKHELQIRNPFSQPKRHRRVHKTKQNGYR